MFPSVKYLLYFWQQLVNLEVLRSPVLEVLEGMLVLVLLCLIFCSMKYQMFSVKVLDCGKVSSGPGLIKVNLCRCNGCRLFFLHCLTEICNTFHEKDVLMGVNVFLKTCINFWRWWCFPRCVSYPWQKHICTPIPSERLAFELCDENSTVEVAVVVYKTNVKSWQSFPLCLWASSKSFGSEKTAACLDVLTYVSFLYDRTFGSICWWYGELCLQTVISGSVPESMWWCPEQNQTWGPQHFQFKCWVFLDTVYHRLVNLSPSSDRFSLSFIFS